MHRSAAVVPSGLGLGCERGLGPLLEGSVMLGFLLEGSWVAISRVTSTLNKLATT